MRLKEIEEVIDKVSKDIDDRYPEANDWTSLICGSIRYELRKVYNNKGEK